MSIWKRPACESGTLWCLWRKEVPVGPFFSCQPEVAKFVEVYGTLEHVERRNTSICKKPYALSTLVRLQPPQRIDSMFFFQNPVFQVFQLFQQSNFGVRKVFQR